MTFALKINKMSEFYMIFVRKCPNDKSLSQNTRILYHICPQNIFPILEVGVKCPKRRGQYMSENSMKVSMKISGQPDIKR